MKSTILVALALSASIVTHSNPKPPTHADDAGVQWEYTYYYPGDRDDGVSLGSTIIPKLDAMGADGWELIEVKAHNGSWVQSAVYFFKRKKKA